VAVILAYSQRQKKSKLINAAVTVSGMGYAMPGIMLALGVYIAFVWLDFAVNDFVFEVFNYELAQLYLSGTLFALLFAYTVRFLAVSLGSIQTGLAKINPSIDQAARSMGRTPKQVLLQIHVPLLKGSVLTALLIVFVDVLKELPATLLLRPFNFNTLAVQAFEMASDERLYDAAPASLMIVLVGLAPVILLSRSISNR
jgi:iron(III) transport system permease protein